MNICPCVLPIGCVLGDFDTFESTTATTTATPLKTTKLVKQQIEPRVLALLSRTRTRERVH